MTGRPMNDIKKDDTAVARISLAEDMSGVWLAVGKHSFCLGLGTEALRLIELSLADLESAHASSVAQEPAPTPATLEQLRDSWTEDLQFGNVGRQAAVLANLLKLKELME